MPARSQSRVRPPRGKWLDRSLMDSATTSLVSQCNHWIDLGGAACRNEARRRGDESEHSCNREINNWIERVNLEKNVLQCSSGDNSEKQRDATDGKDRVQTKLSGHLRN